jgi:2-(1,2-epoxy-1,2-dihydrophenyl)acetyl-CoA isomerase
MPLLKAKEKVFFAEPISAQEALTLGMVNTVVPAEELIRTAEAWAARLVNMPTRVLGIHKRQLHMSLDSTLERSIYDEANALVLTHLTEDAGEAMRAFREKREGVYTGR